MRTILLITMVATVAFGCGNTTENTQQNEQESARVMTETEVADENHPLLASYIRLKNALVESDPEAATAAAEEIATKASGEISETAKEIAESTDLEHQRDHFFALSNAMYNYVKNQESLGQTVYWQYCPMARDNEGANWLSLESEIRNPYFGDAMLTCGAVEEELNQ